MRCSGRRAGCTKNGYCKDRMAVALDDSVSRKYAEMHDGNGMRKFTEKQRAEVTVVWRGCRHGGEIQPKKLGTFSSGLREICLSCTRG